MVFYFTATGNSLYVAEQLDGKCISIPQAIHGDMNFKDEKIGIVCPVYGHEMPDMVKEFVKKATFDTDYLYLVETYGHRHGGANELAEKIFEESGKHTDYATTISLVDNFLPGFDMNEEREFDKQRDIEKHIAQIKEDISSKKRWHQPVTDEDRAVHQMYLDRMKNVPDGYWGKLYTVTDACIGCGICTKVCPVGCIELKDQRAVHHLTDAEGNVICNTCMACIHHCPKNAIKLNIPEKNPDARYRNEHIGLKDIVEANNQNKQKEE